LAIIALSTEFKMILAGQDLTGGPGPVASITDKAKAEPPADLISNSSLVKLATERNAHLEAQLNWTFGGKTQRGWQLYLPLICQLIGSSGDAQSSDFALSLLRWQESLGLNPTGVLDHGTWSLMISMWQSQRTKGAVLAPAEQLLQAPASDFYHPSRPPELRQVERQTYAAYKQMVAAAAADPALGLAVTAEGDLAPSERFLKIISAFRSPEYQAQLRKQSPRAGRAALAVSSPHFTGRALDLYVGGEPVITRDDNRALQTRTRVYQWLVKHAEKFGFYPYFYEPWHWEYRPAQP
jgi:LAS superfamily LD-carboxypeptidase LdcB